MKTGLILEGGAFRGMFTSGILDVLDENHITFDGLIGVSAGAVFGCNFKSHQIGRALRYNKRFIKDPRYASFRSLIKTGNYFSKDFAYDIVPKKLDVFDEDAFVSNPMAFYMVCSDVVSGKPFYFQTKGKLFDDIDYLRASASMPVFSRIVNIDNHLLLDGGCTDSIPIKYFESLGYNKNIVILTQPRGYVKEKNKHMWLIKHVYKNYPNFIAATKNRHRMYNDTTRYIFEKEAKGELLVIAPSEPLNIKPTTKDPKELQRVYHLGRQEGLKQLEHIKQYLNQ